MKSEDRTMMFPKMTAYHPLAEKVLSSFYTKLENGLAGTPISDVALGLRSSRVQEIFHHTVKKIAAQEAAAECKVEDDVPVMLCDYLLDWRQLSAARARVESHEDRQTAREQVLEIITELETLANVFARYVTHRTPKLPASQAAALVKLPIDGSMMNTSRMARTEKAALTRLMRSGLVLTYATTARKDGSALTYACLTDAGRMLLDQHAVAMAFT